MNATRLMIVCLLGVGILSGAVFGQLVEVKDKPKLLHEVLADTRANFKTAAEALSTKEGKDFLAACEKMSEAYVIYAACGRTSDFDPEVRRIAHTGPLSCNRNDQIMVQILWTTYYEDWVVAGEEYLKLLPRVNEKTRTEAARALCKAIGEPYAPEVFSAYICEYRKEPIYLGERKDRANVACWQRAIKNLTSPDKKETGGSPKSLGNGNVRTSYNLVLCMKPGTQLGSPGPGCEMVSKDEFALIWQQVSRARDNLRNPPEEFQSDSARVTCWQRDAENDEPPMLLKTPVPTRVCLPCGPTSIAVQNDLRTSFAMGLCQEWKERFADFRKSLPTDGVSPDYMAAWTSGHYEKYCRDYRTIRLESDADKKWATDMFDKLKELRELYLGAELKKWHPITIEEYTKLLAEREEWLKNHPATDSWSYKERLCRAFERLYPSFSEWDTVNVNTPTKFTLEALESVQPDKVTIANPR